MTTFYSPHFTDETPNATALGVVAKPRVTAPAGFDGANLKYKNAIVDLTSATLATNDVIRMFSMKSGDRLTELYLSNLPAWAATALTVNVGLYKSEPNHTGAVIDLNLFADEVDIAATVNRANMMNESVTVLPLHAGKQLWELATLGAGSYTEDPHEMWDFCIQIHLATTITVYSSLKLEALYVTQLGA